MDLDTLKRIIQDFFQQNTVTIVGSGLSRAEGIPGMHELAEELKDKMPKFLSGGGDIEIWRMINDDLLGGKGLEEALHNTKPSNDIEENIRRITAKFIGEKEEEVLKEVIQGKKKLRFSDYLNHFNINNSNLVVITTNYDRLVEYACEYNKLHVDTLFTGRFLAYFDQEKSKYSGAYREVRVSGRKYTPVFPSRVTVLKPHGCLSWHLINEVPYSIPGYPVDDSLIITPGINKYKEGYNSPFDTHRETANSEIDRAERYIIIGYGFGDDHLETHLLNQLKAGKPALILSRSLSPKAKNLVENCENITAIVRDNSTGSRVVTSRGETSFDINLWDIQSMLKEVF